VAAGVNYHKVSDDAYFVDFGESIINTSQRVLPQEGFLSYGRPTWSTALRVIRNQTLVDPLAPITKPYEKVPQLTFNAQRYDLGGFDVGVAVDATKFGHPTLEEGSRFIVNPVISYPWLAPGYFVVPKLQWHATQYELDENLRPGAASPTRTVPMASLDAGLVFEKDGSWLGRPAIHTLEPRLYYARVPFRDQSTLPVFDTAEADFNFAQLFTENRFVGGDRIAEADQLTAALVARVLDPDTGAERLRTAIGQRYYFGQQRVTLPGQEPQTGRESDLLVSAAGAIHRRWIVDGTLQHSTLQNQIVRASMGVRYQPRSSSVLSLRYRYKINELDQLDMAAQWPLDFMGLPRWYGVGRANYSYQDGRWIELLGGLEYKADCWVMRVVAQSYVTSAATRTTTVYVQIELNGLGGVGSSPVETLKRNIPGYQVINRAPATPGRYDVYE
jgi:LPS-assembly protein